MKKSLFSAALLISLLPTAAMADPANQLSCPEGSVPFINAQTYEVVCMVQSTIPTTGATNPPAAAPDAVQNAELAQTSQNPAPETVQSEASAAPTQTAPAADENTAVTAAQPENINAVDPEKPVITPEMRDLYHRLNWRATGAKAAERQGFGMSFGLGYGYLGAANINLNLGYQYDFQNTNVAFGLFGDVNLKFGLPTVTTDIVLEPALIFTINNFRFSFALGLGAFIIYDKTEEDCYYRYDDNLQDYVYKCDDDNVVAAGFELKPAFKFDWFLSENTWIGFVVDIPMMLSEGMFSRDFFVWFDIYFRAGYKF